MERVSLTLFGALLCVGSFAQPGSLDTGFGNGGTLTTDFGIPSAEATAIAQLPDGRLLVAGYTNAGANYDPALAMYLPNGDLDPSFGEGGLVSVSLDVAAAIHTLAVRPDGRILIAGSAAGSEDGNAIVLQFLPDGTLDPDLGAMGYVTHSIPGGIVSPRAMVLRPDGGLVLTGNHFVGTVSHLMFIALHADGTPDETFGTDGHATFLPRPTTMWPMRWSYSRMGAWSCADRPVAPDRQAMRPCSWPVSSPMALPMSRSVTQAS